MKMLTDLFSTDYGLMSLAVIVFTLGMAVWFGAFSSEKWLKMRRTPGIEDID